jgi:hypothetical protein
MKNTIALAALILSVTACAAAPVARDTLIPASESAPAQVAGQWKFQVTGKDGIREPLVILTTKPAETCLSGQWFKVVPVSSHGLAFSKPVYSYSKGRLELLLSSELCDAYTSLIGTVAGSSFSGTHVSYGLFGSTEHGKVTGARQP